MSLNPDLEKHVEAVYQLLTQYAQDPRAAQAVHEARARLEKQATNPDLSPEQLVDIRFRALKLTTFMKAVHSYATWRMKLAKRKRTVKLRLAHAAAASTVPVDRDYECDECGLQGWEIPLGGSHADDCPNLPKEPPTA